MDLDRRPPIHACPGDTVELSAPGEGIGGFTWQAEVPDHSATLIDESMSPPQSGIGAGRDKLFRFRMERAGETVLRLVQKRPWEASAHRIIECKIHCGTAP
ncbi:protease inhibitor I42 family protein [Methylobacterium sp. J-090]|uniref:protease inhibitor I42 family protein n=1 Tax=Methylobacterium sp. J-090 TaxID=2836666 RepID=UPI00391A0199